MSEESAGLHEAGPALAGLLVAANNHWVVFRHTVLATVALPFEYPVTTPEYYKTPTCMIGVLCSCVHELPLLATVTLQVPLWSDPDLMFLQVGLSESPSDMSSGWKIR